jgi:hypothetical protein
MRWEPQTAAIGAWLNKLKEPHLRFEVLDLKFEKREQKNQLACDR